MRPILGASFTCKNLACALVVAGAIIFSSLHNARAETAYCSDLRNQIAKAGTDGAAARYRAAAAKQKTEYNRLAARAHAMGCDREQFLFFGDPPPPQCGGVNAQLNALRGTIASYDRGGSDDSQRQALMARYEIDCRNPRDVSARDPRPRGFFEELFGVAPTDQATGVREVPIGPADEPLDGGAEDDDLGEPRPSGGPVAICVRDCDGGFFPITYRAKNSQLDDLNSLCKAMCPGTEAKLYTQSQSGGLRLGGLDRRRALFRTP